MLRVVLLAVAMCEAWIRCAYCVSKIVTLRKRGESDLPNDTIRRTKEGEEERNDIYTSGWGAWGEEPAYR